MSPQRTSEGLGPQDISAWVEQEIRHTRKAAELRIKAAKEIATAVAESRISAEEAAGRIYQHERRWGEALPGVWDPEGKTDEEIIAVIDGARNRTSRASRDVSKRSYGREP